MKRRGPKFEERYQCPKPKANPQGPGKDRLLLVDDLTVATT